MSLRTLLLSLFLLLLAQPAFATVTGVSTNPDHRNVNFSGGATTLTVVWVIDRATTGAPVDLRSNAGRLRVVNAVLATTPIRRKIYTGNPATVTFVETITIPQLVMRRAMTDNGGNFIYERDWADDGAFVTGSIDLTVTGGMGGPLGLNEVTLAFDNGATFDTVHRDDTLRAVARIQSSGSGQLTGVWEVNDGTADAFYRPIRTVNVTLTGRRMINEISPPLPTKEDGRHNVRFRVTSPPGSDIKPVITYFVTGEGGGGKAGKLQVYGPAADASLNANTGFGWKAVKGAVAYRLQILDTADNPVSSMLVRKTEAILSAFVLSQLQGPATYKWRVAALGPDGDIIATSQPRAIRVKGR